MAALTHSRDSIARTATLSTTAQIAAYGLGFLASVIIARALGPTGRGQYAVVVTAVAVVAAVVHVSLENANAFYFAERDYSVDQLSRNTSLAAVAAGPVAVGVLLVLYAVSRNTLFGRIPLATYLVGVACAPFALHLLWITALYTLDKRMIRSQVATLAGAGFQLVAIFILYVAGALTVGTVIGVYTATSALIWLFHVWWSRGVMTTRPALDRQLMRGVVGYGLKLHMGFIGIYLLFRLDVFFVRGYLGPRQVGLYSLAVQFAELIWLLTTPLSMAALPFQAAGSRDEATQLSFRTARIGLLIALTLAGTFAATLWWVVPTVYGSAFAGSYRAIILLLPGVIAMAFARPLLTWLIRHDRPWRWSGLALGALALNCVINIWLIPRIGISGASLASSAAYIALAASYVHWGLSASSIGWREALVPRRSDVPSIGKVIRALRAY